MSISTYLRAERGRLGLLQKDFAALGGVNPKTQENYEKGFRFPDTNYLSALARHGVNVYFLLTGKHSPDKTDDEMLSIDEWQLILKYRAAPPSLKAAAAAVLMTHGPKAKMQNVMYNYDGSTVIYAPTSSLNQQGDISVSFAPVQNVKN